MGGLTRREFLKLTWRTAAGVAAADVLKLGSHVTEKTVGVNLVDLMTDQTKRRAYLGVGLNRRHFDQIVSSQVKVADGRTKGPDGLVHDLANVVVGRKRTGVDGHSLPVVIKGIAFERPDYFYHSIEGSRLMKTEADDETVKLFNFAIASGMQGILVPADIRYSPPSEPIVTLSSAWAQETVRAFEDAEMGGFSRSVLGFDDSGNHFAFLSGTSVWSALMTQVANYDQPMFLYPEIMKRQSLAEMDQF